MQIKDRIRNMSDKELTGFLAWLIDEGNEEVTTYIKKWINEEWTAGHEDGLSMLAKARKKKAAAA